MESVRSPHLWHRSIRRQVPVGRDPEHGEAVQAERYADVVRDRDVGVARVAREGAVAVGAGRLEDDGQEREDRLQLDVLCRGGVPLD